VCEKRDNNSSSNASTWQSRLETNAVRKAVERKLTALTKAVLALNSSAVSLEALRNEVMAASVGTNTVPFVPVVLKKLIMADSMGRSSRDLKTLTDVPSGAFESNSAEDCEAKFEDSAVDVLLFVCLNACVSE
jgi:hypothetical protein